MFYIQAQNSCAHSFPLELRFHSRPRGPLSIELVQCLNRSGLITQTCVAVCKGSPVKLHIVRHTCRQAHFKRNGQCHPCHPGRNPYDVLAASEGSCVKPFLKGPRQTILTGSGCSYLAPLHAVARSQSLKKPTKSESVTGTAIVPCSRTLRTCSGNVKSTLSENPTIYSSKCST